MNAKRPLCISLALCLFTLSSCTPSEEPSYISSKSSKISESISISSSVPSETPSASSESQEMPTETNVSGPEPLEFEDIDFTVMSEEELKEVFGRVLDKAIVLCRYGLACNPGEYDDDPELKTVHSFRGHEYDYYPVKNCPYKSIEELKEDFLTVFAPELINTKFSYVFEGLIDYNGQIYVATNRGGVSRETHWVIEDMEVINVSTHECTVSMPVLLGWDDSKRTVDSLTFQFIDKHIIVGMDYFALPD